MSIKDSNMRGLAVILAVVCGLAGQTTSFPNGAPVEACIYNTVPNHVGTESKQESTFEHEFVAEAGAYGHAGNRRGPGSIDVHVRGTPFKGFFIQAIDDDYKPIGSWVKNKFSKLHNECSAITHNNPGPKKDITLTWVPPSNGKSGNVYFRATILESYDKYWSKVFAKVLKHGPF